MYQNRGHRYHPFGNCQAFPASGTSRKSTPSKSFNVGRLAQISLAVRSARLAGLLFRSLAAAPGAGQSTRMG
jgi:hypothetical protein